MATNRDMRRRDLTAQDRDDLYALVPAARSRHVEPLIVMGIGPLGCEPDLYRPPGHHKRRIADMLISVQKVRALGYVIDLQAVGPRGEPRWVIAGHYPAQATAYELGLIGGRTGRSLDDADPEAVAIVNALETEPDFLVALAAELTSGTRDFAAGLAVARQACT